MLKLPMPSVILKQDYANRLLQGLVDRVINGCTITKNGKSIHYELDAEVNYP